MNIEEIKMDHFENFEELIKTCKLWIEIDDIDAYYRFFEFNCMKAFVTAYEKEKEKNRKYLVNLTHEQYIKLVEQIRSEINEEWKDKIKAKIEEVKDGTYDAKIVLQSLLEKE